MKQIHKRLMAMLLTVALAISIAGPAAAEGAPSGYGSNKVAPIMNTVSQAELPDRDWQGTAAFPDWQNYVDDTLAMNSLYSFTMFAGQGELYVTPAAGVTGFRLFVNNAEIDTAPMAAGKTWKVDISELALDGTNTVQVTNITPADLADAVTVHVPYPVVLPGAPADVGMDEDVVGLIGDFIEAEVKYGFSGAQLAVVKDGRLVISEAWGAANGYNPDGSRIRPGDENYVPVTTDTLYDLASNTKMYSVNYAIQYLVDRQQIDLDAHITDFFPTFDDAGKTVFKEGTTDAQKENILQWKSQLRVRDILMHQAGFDPDPQYHNDKFNQATQKPDPAVDNPLFSQNRETTLEKVLASPLTYQPGTKTVYSDVDYMLLCFIVEQVVGKGLDEFLKETFWDPMGLTHMTYNPLENGFTKEQTAATELQGNTRGEDQHGQRISFRNVRTDTVWGEVHDEKAYYAMEGVSGHAGLFSNAEDLAKLASVMLTGGYGGHRFFSPNTIDEFIKPKSMDYPTWGLGWYRQAELGRTSYFSTQASNAAIGHQGWTGTLTVVDPEEDLVVVVLTNKKNSPVIDNTVDANDFYSDNMVLGALGGVVGMVYDALRSSGDAMDSTVLQMAHDRIRLMMSHEDKYDEGVHMNDAFALVDLAVTRAEERKSEVTRANAALALKNLKDFVAIYIVRQENKDNAAAWAADMQARIDAIVTDGSAPAAPGLMAEYTGAVTDTDFEGSPFNGGDMNYVYFPRPYSPTGSTSTVYYNTGTWFDGYEGQGTLYLYLGKALTVDGGIRIFVNGVEVDNSNLTGQTGIFAIDVSGVARNGRNSIQVTIPNINETARTSTRIAVANPTVVEGAPSQVGLDARALDMIDSIVQNDVDNGFTSAQMAVVKDGRLVYSNAWGTVNAYNPDGTPKTDSAPVTTDTLYDLASNTKMYATNYAVQYLVQQKKMALTDPITKYFPNFASDTIEIRYAVSQGTGAPDLETARAWKAQLTVADILQHQAGFAPDPQFHNNQFNQATQKPEPGTDNVLYAIGKDNVAAAICKAPLVYEPGTKTVYSDVDYMLLGLIVEQVTGKDLDTFLKETFYTPLGLSRITYNPLDHGFTASEIAATELNGNSRDGAIDFDGIREGTIQGTVHDEKAYYAMGGVSGHAGLFSNAEDLARLAQTMLNPTGYGTHRLFGANVNEYFVSRKDSSATWGQGWWRQGDCGRPWYFGVQASRGTIGHQGWTGTLTMIDPAEDLVVVYLTNKINSPVTDNTVSANQFDGNWYTASTLGFVANILYQGLDSHDASGNIQPALDALMGDMAIDKLRLVDGEGTADAGHPIVKAAYSLADAVFDAAQARPTEQNIRAAGAVVDALDANRDVEKVRQLRARLELLDPTVPPSDTVKIGAEVLLESEAWKEHLKGKNVALFTNQVCVDKDMEHLADRLAADPDINLVCMFGGEHGLRGAYQAGAAVPHAMDPTTGLPVWSLYNGGTIDTAALGLAPLAEDLANPKNPNRPTMAMLTGNNGQWYEPVDVILFDLQEIGSKTWTYMYTLADCMMACVEARNLAGRDVEFIVLDRPSTISSDVVEGTMTQPGNASGISRYPLPSRYGLTMGELARLYQGEGYKNYWTKGAPGSDANEYGGTTAAPADWNWDDPAMENKISLADCRLTVVPCQGYTRDMYWDETDLQFILPSPNMPTWEAALIYTGTVWFEGPTINEGRGTTKPFELISAPYIDPIALAQRMNELELPGVRFRAASITPYIKNQTPGNYANILSHGVQIHITDKRAFSPVEMQTALFLTLRAMYGGAGDDHFNMPASVDQRTGSTWVREAVNAFPVGAGREQILDKTAEMMARMDDEMQDYLAIRDKYLMRAYNTPADKELVNTPEPVISLGYEALLADRMDLLEGKKVGLVTNQTGVDKDLNHLADVLDGTVGVELTTLFSGGCGLRGEFQTPAAGDYEDNVTGSGTGLPVHRLYGTAPTAEQLANVEVLLFDMQDSGTRANSSAGLMADCMRACAENGVAFVLLDRPDPLGGTEADGPVEETGGYPIPTRYGMTLGELALMLKGEFEREALENLDLTVVPMEGWSRDMYYDETGLQYVMADRKIPTAKTALTYAALGWLEGTGQWTDSAADQKGVSSGWGTTKTYEFFGAPFIQPRMVEFAQALNDCGLPGVRFRMAAMTPWNNATEGAAIKFPNTACYGVQMHVYDEHAYSPVDTALAILTTLQELFPENAAGMFTAEFDQIVGNTWMAGAIKEGKSAAELRAGFQAGLEEFRDLREDYLLYGADKSELDALIQSAEEKAEERYTPESWAPFAQALEAAKKVSADSAATQADIDNALAELDRRLQGLVEQSEDGKWTVTFRSRDSAEQVKVADGQSVSDPRDFIGWYMGGAAKFYADSDYTAPWNFGDAITQDTTIYVQVTEEVPGDRLVRVMTYNIRYGHNNDDQYDLQSIADVISASEADVVCLQEVDVNWGERSEYDDTLAILAEMTGMESFHAYIYDVPSKRGPEYPNERFGVAFLSRYPIETSANHEITRWSTQPGDPQPGEEGFPGMKPGFGEIVVDIDGLKFRAYNTHLDYRGAPPEGYPHTIRLDQVRDMLEIMDTTTAPAILTGDMNADAANPDAAEVFDPLLEHFADAWAEKGIGDGGSYPSDVPAGRIDYIFTTASMIDVVNAFRIDSQASDHRPVVADLLVHGDPQERAVTVTGGTADPAAATRGTTVTITAEEGPNQTFTGWTVLSGGVTLANAGEKVTTFTMGDQPVEIEANFETEAPPYIPPASSNKETVTVRNPDGSTTVTVTNKTTGTVTATTTYPDGAKTVVETRKDGTVTTTIQTKDNVKSETVTTPAGKTTAAVTLPKDKSAVVTIPVKDVGPGTVAYLVKDDGTRELVRKTAVGDGCVYVPLSGSARLEIADNGKRFADVPAGDWAADAVSFVTGRELFQGIGENAFAPAVPMSRAMLVTVLHRLENEPQAGSASFADVADGQWYTGAVRWAAANGIVKGTGGGLFDPSGNVTREQIAVILYQYAKYCGTLTEADGDAANGYADSAAVSPWAAEAMGWAVRQGLLTGKPGNLLAPSDSATRAEVALILMRFINS